jgi:hypothetical protein
MRTIIVIGEGLVLLGIFVLVGRATGGASAATSATSALYFIPVWLVAAAVNMLIGVARAGYTVAEEFPIFLGVFGVPAALAGYLWWRFARG